MELVAAEWVELEPAREGGEGEDEEVAGSARGRPRALLLLGGGRSRRRAAKAARLPFFFLLLRRPLLSRDPVMRRL
jgi:hypothetical protein